MIKKFEEFVNEELELRHEKYYTYTQEECEQINEGFKDFVKKFALTTAIATSCLTAMAKPIVVNNPDKVIETQKEILAKAEKDTKQDCKLFIAKGSSEEWAKKTANNAFVAKFGNRAKILDTQIIQTKMDNGKPLFKCVIIYTE